ncbi:MAG TPA: sensor domain-containing diguanylate cyclase [Usitatibacter sp.]|nr:sensor domain-containing diguanylate cyclase [Usitatibacter sp.]
MGALEARLVRLPTPDRARSLAELAWHLRQRDTRRAQSLADEALAVLPPVALADEHARSVATRAALTLAECDLLFLRVDEARRRARQCVDAFAALDDPAGVGDAWLLLARIAQAGGDGSGERAACAAALDAYSGARDPARSGVARATNLLARLPRDRDAARAEVEAIRSMAPPAAAQCLLRYVDALLAYQAGEVRAAYDGFTEAARLAAAAGLGELALNAEFSIAGVLSSLGDARASLAAGENVLAIARQKGWPHSIAGALAHVGRTLTQMGEAARAVEALTEATIAIAPLGRSRHAGALLSHLGAAQFALGRHEQALAQLREAEGILREHGLDAELSTLLVRMARVLARVGDGDAAEGSALEALALARRSAGKPREAEALRALGEIHSAHPSDARTPRSALAYFRHALELVDELGLPEKPQLLAEIARVHEKAGDLRGALAAERAARAEQDVESHRRAANAQLLAALDRKREHEALQEQHERALAEAQAANGRATQDALGTVEAIRAAGDEVSQHIDAPRMVEALAAAIARLAAVDSVAMYVCDEAGARLRRHEVEGGRALPLLDIGMSDLDSYVARAARERREFLVELQTPAPDGRVAGMASLWFAPLAVAERTLGVLTVQTRQLNAYGEREKLIFRALASYVAVALARTHVRTQLESERQRAVDAEAQVLRLATTDPMTELPNRRRFFEAALQELERSRRGGGPVGLLVVNLDRLKVINDTRGNLAGDRAIEAVARVVAEHQRPNDLAARIGSEEFALLLPGAPFEAVFEIAERIRTQVEALRLSWDGHPLPVTASVGCTGLRDAARQVTQPATVTLERLLREADAALYEAKGAGRNRVIAWPAYAALYVLHDTPDQSRA